MEPRPRTLDGWTQVWLGCAAIWSLGLVAAGFLVSSYSTTNGPSKSLVQENGVAVLIPLLVPLLCVAVVAISLWRRRQAQMSGVGVVVWMVFGLLSVGVALSVFTIGPFVAPIAVFIITAITRVKGQPLTMSSVYD